MNTDELTDYVEGAVRRLTEEIRRRIIPDVLISCAEAARILKVNPSTISNYVKQKRIVKRTIGGVTGLLLSDVMGLQEKKRSRRETAGPRRL